MLWGKSAAHGGPGPEQDVTAGAAAAAGEAPPVHPGLARQHSPAEAGAVSYHRDRYFVRKTPFPVALYYTKPNKKEGAGEGCNGPKLQATISEHNGEKEKSNGVLKFNLENIFSRPLRDVREGAGSSPLTPTPAAAAQLEPSLPSGWDLLAGVGAAISLSSHKKTFCSIKFP